MSTHSVPSTPAEPGVDQVRAIRPTRHHQIVVAGGGIAGATVSAWLCRKLDNPDVAVIEPVRYERLPAAVDSRRWRRRA